MFSRVDYDVVGFNPSNSKVDSDLDSKKSFFDSSSQTEIEVGDKESQAKSSQNFEVQTEEVVRNLTTDYNVDSLASFLNKVYPSLTEELDKVEKSRAFSLYLTAAEEGFENEVNVIHTILSENIPELPKVRVSSIGWSCTDNVVIVAYESTEHEDWCAHSSCVDFFNTKMSDFNGKTPTYSIPTSSCVTAIAPHPYEPSIVAVGTAGGEVHIWNLQKGQFDADLGNSVFHEDKITKLSWESVNSQLFLISSSVDSYMFFYKVTPSISSVQLYERFRMTTDTSKLEAGILSFSFSTQPGVFAVGLESGEIIHCSTFGAPSIPMSPAKNPVLRVMCKQNALVVDIKFSPHNENIFAATFTNNKLLGFSLKETAPLFDMFMDFDILGLSWSKIQKNVFFMWGKTQKLSVHEGSSGRLLTELQPDNVVLTVIKSIAFCSKSPRLALSGSDGKVMIWDIPSVFKI